MGHSSAPAVPVIDARSSRSPEERREQFRCKQEGQRKDAMPSLEQLLKHADVKTVDDARVAMDAIRRKNHHYFIDRNHSDSAFWEVNAEDVRY